MELKPRRKWPKDFRFMFNEISDYQRQQFKDVKITEQTFDCLMKEFDNTEAASQYFVNDLILNQFFQMINEECKSKGRPLIILTTFVLPSLIMRESDPAQYSKLAKKT